MNLFVLDEDIETSARYLDDKRINKMMLETLQVISTVLHSYGLPVKYKPTHAKHPVTLWTGDTAGNMVYMCRYYIALSNERMYRLGRTHKCDEVFQEMQPTIMKYIAMRSNLETTPFANCSLFKDESNIVTAYRKTMIHKWTNDKRKPTWTKREVPSWYSNV
jgi:hypothetical protein